LTVERMKLSVANHWEHTTGVYPRVVNRSSWASSCGVYPRMLNKSSYASGCGVYPIALNKSSCASGCGVYSMALNKSSCVRVVACIQEHWANLPVRTAMRQGGLVQCEEHTLGMMDPHLL
jgi:hypothetical protein